MKWFAKKVFDGGGNDLKNQRKSNCYISRFAEKLKLFSENLKNLYKKRNTSAGCRSVKNPFAWFFRKKSTGVAILETAMTLPIVLYVIFFAVELVRMELAQTAVDAITKEFTFYLMAKGKIVQSEVDAIFLKYKPWGIPIGYFRYYIRLYENIETMMATAENSPYGGETIGWACAAIDPDPTALPTTNANGYVYGLTTKCALLKKYQTSIVDGTFGEKGSDRRTLLKQASGVPSGYAFVLTVAVKFPFSSPFIAKLFNGGSNTNKKGVYILWARGSGMIN